MTPLTIPNSTLQCGLVCGCKVISLHRPEMAFRFLLASKRKRGCGGRAPAMRQQALKGFGKKRTSRLPYSRNTIHFSMCCWEKAACRPRFVETALAVETNKGGLGENGVFPQKGMTRRKKAITTRLCFIDMPLPLKYKIVLLKRVYIILPRVYMFYAICRK